MSRTKRSFWNVATGLLMTALTLGIGFISTPYILRWLGAERFGAFRVLMDWFGYLALLDLGVIGAVEASLGPKLGAGDDQGVQATLSAGLRIYLWISALMLVGGALLVLTLPRFLHLTTVTTQELLVAAWILLIPVVWFPISVFRALMEARQRSYLVNLLLTSQALLTTTLLVLAARAGWGLIGQAAATTLALVPAPAVLLWMGLRHYRNVLAMPPDRKAMAELRALNWPTFWFNLSGRLGLLSDNIVIAFFVGPLAVAPFFLTQRLAQIAQGQLQAIGNSTWAGLVELHAQGQTRRFCDRMTELTTLISGAGLAVLGPVAAYNQHFIRLWVGQSYYAGHWVTAMACVNIWLWAISSFWGWPISGSGNIASLLPYAIAFTILNVSVSVLGVLTVGLPGPLIGTFAAFLLIHSWAMPRILSRIFAPELASIWKSAVRPLLWGLPYAAVLWFVAQSQAPLGWLALGVQTSVAASGGFLLWWLHLKPESQLEWKKRVRFLT